MRANDSASQPPDGAEPEPNGTAPARQGLIEGLVIEKNRGVYRVDLPGGPLVCTIRGRLRKQLEYATSESTAARKSVKRVRVMRHDPIAVGDRVLVRPTLPGEGVIEEVVARGGAFTREDPQGGREQLTPVAGIDQVVAVFAAREPTPHLRLLDRFLVVAEARGLAAIVCLNKVDLGIEPWLADRLRVYHAIGYPVVLTSAATGDGLEELRARLAGHTSALLGPSGVGKSSLLNAIEPSLGQRVSEISRSTGKGRHTTRGTLLAPLHGPGGGYIADTAGIRALAVDQATLERLDWCFREFRPYLDQCRLSDCTHLHEPGCAVREAVRAGAIDAERYDSFVRLHPESGGASELAEEDWSEVG